MIAAVVSCLMVLLAAVVAAALVLIVGAIVGHLLEAAQ